MAKPQPPSPPPPEILKVNEPPPEAVRPDQRDVMKEVAELNRKVDEYIARMDFWMMQVNEFLKRLGGFKPSERKVN